GGVFSSLLSKCNETNSDFIRAYSSYVASSVILSLIKDQPKKSNIKFDIPFSITDRTTLVRAIKSLTEYVQDSYSFSSVKRKTSSFFSEFLGYTLAKINSSDFTDLRKKYSNYIIKGPNFEINGLEKVLLEKQLEKQKSEFKITPYIFSPIEREDIIGNQQAINAVESSVNCLMHYSNGENPFFGFDQFLAFLGGPGTGKSMTAVYAMSLAKNISEKYNIPILISELNFEDSFQYGPLINLRTQLQKISTANKPHIVFIDEFDSKLPSRSSLVNSSYKSEVIGEFLRFRGGAYTNNGNYLFLITSNNPSGIDPAIFRVFNPLYVQGPRTPEEKLEVLQRNMNKGTELGYVKINDWESILHSLEGTELTGSDLNKIAGWAEEKFRKISSIIPFNLSTDEKLKLIKSKGKKYITTEQDVLRAISNYQYAKELGDECYV
ncbi:MAG: ATP-binding protein, partial [Nanoarchaeota archaeon]|nr:ATP-binding protein [Nanoarchaeota archaeon]